jgi:ParB/RepB/Spo0J family partition protein
MTSGEFHSIPVDKIWVVRDERQRKELTGIKDLADSIRRLGLIHPLVIDRNFKLCAGERRFAAVKMLGHTHVMCQFLDELNPAHQRIVELEENVKRVNLTWQEIAAAVAEHYAIQCSENEGWTHQQTADAFGLDRSDVTHYLTVAEEAKTDESLLGHKLFSTARNIVQRTKQHKFESALRELLDDPITEKDIKHADFIEWAPTYTGPKFNFLHCDFPYGIGTDKRNMGNAIDVHGGYDDSEETYWRLLKALCDNLDRLCTESAHIMFWFSMHYYQRTLDYFAENSDFVIDPFPLVWMKNDGASLPADPARGPRRIYETCLFGRRGDRKIISAVANAYAGLTDRLSGHPSTKPEPVLHHFFSMFVNEHSYMLDPTCGSGTALRAAEALRAAHVLGIESNKDFADRAIIALEEARQKRAA